MVVWTSKKYCCRRRPWRLVSGSIKGHFKNIKIIFQNIENNNLYAKAIQTETENFDIIIVDGKIRNICVQNSISKLSENGVLILDDSFREDYKTSFEFMKNNGFKYLNFWGMTPVISTKSCTTVFYKNNVFNL